MEFEKKLFKGFVAPGVIIIWILILLSILPEKINPLLSISLLKHPISGPGAIGVGLTLLPVEIQLLVFLLVTLIYSIVLPFFYFRKRHRFVPATRTFLMFGNIVMIALLVQSVILIAPLSPSDYEGYINIAVVAFILFAGFAVLGYFSYWLVEVYKHEQIKVFSTDTCNSITYALAMYIGPPLLLLLLLNL